MTEMLWASAIPTNFFANVFVDYGRRARTVPCLSGRDVTKKWMGDDPNKALLLLELQLMQPMKSSCVPLQYVCVRR